MAIVITDAVDQVVTKPGGKIQVRAVRTTTTDGVVTSTEFHRHVVKPGDDYSNEAESVRTACAAAHTSEVIAAYQAKNAAYLAGL
jgi:hypothetical protein